MSEQKLIDYGEPWATDGVEITDERGALVVAEYRDASDFRDFLAPRIVACVNACAGIADPEAAIARARKALKAAVSELLPLDLAKACVSALAALTPKEKKQ